MQAKTHVCLLAIKHREAHSLDLIINELRFQDLNHHGHGKMQKNASERTVLLTSCETPREADPSDPISQSKLKIPRQAITTYARTRYTVCASLTVGTIVITMRTAIMHRVNALVRDHNEELQPILDEKVR